ncbi:hypothetical protein DAI22_08g108600 [Oryza sativa Japonica Group]|nr:hypothetical protein DAI22_08g108600 [Oryza sativa Japonica Group]
MSAASSSHPPPLPLTEPRSSLAAAADSPRINSTIDTPVLSPQPWSPLDAQAADFRAQCRTAVLPNLARLRPHWLSMPPEHYRRRGRHYGPLHCQGQADLVTSPPRLPTPSPSTASAHSTVWSLLRASPRPIWRTALSLVDHQRRSPTLVVIANSWPWWKLLTQSWRA